MDMPVNFLLSISAFKYYSANSLLALATDKCLQASYASVNDNRQYPTQQRPNCCPAEYFLLCHRSAVFSLTDIIGPPALAILALTACWP